MSVFFFILLDQDFKNEFIGTTMKDLKVFIIIVILVMIS